MKTILGEGNDTISVSDNLSRNGIVVTCGFTHVVIPHKEAKAVAKAIATLSDELARERSGYDWSGVADLHNITGKRFRICYAGNGGLVYPDSYILCRVNPNQWNFMNLRSGNRLTSPPFRCKSDLIAYFDKRGQYVEEIEK